MAACPDSLTWMLIKDHNSFHHKRNGNTNRSGSVTLSSEKGNLNNTNSSKYSGLANSKTIHFNARHVKRGEKLEVKIAMQLKVPRKSHKPAKSIRSIHLRQKNIGRAEKTVASQTIDSHYRNDLIRTAMKRWARLHSMRRVAEGIDKPLNKQPGRKASKASRGAAVSK